MNEDKREYQNSKTFQVELIIMKLLGPMCVYVCVCVFICVCVYILSNFFFFYIHTQPLQVMSQSRPWKVPDNSRSHQGLQSRSQNSSQRIDFDQHHLMEQTQLSTITTNNLGPAGAGIRNIVGLGLLMLPKDTRQSGFPYFLSMDFRQFFVFKFKLK